jgi:CIC family chloride channel protein
MNTCGHYYVEGVGYSTVQEILSGWRIPLLLLVILCGLKLLATALTLGSGASGGIFSPTLFLGATAGAAYGMVLEKLFPGLGVSAPAFAVAGMAGLVGGATGAAMAAIVMIFEMTLDYNVIVPMTITVAISYGIRKMLSRESIYTMKLARRGHYTPDALHASLHLVQRANKIMQPSFGRIAASSRLDGFARQFKNKPGAPEIFLVMDEEKITGYVLRETVLNALNDCAAFSKVSELARQDYIVVDERATFFEIVANWRASAAALAVVVKGGVLPGGKEVTGVITKEQLGEAVIESSEMLMD